MVHYQSLDGRIERVANLWAGLEMHVTGKLERDVLHSPDKSHRHRTFD